MKDIKFRGLSKTTGKFVYGNLIQTSEYKDGHIHCWIQEKSLLGLGALSTPTKNFIEVHSESVGQFIDLQDKNGISIYEGDVIQFSDKYEWHRSPFQSKDEIKEILEDHVKYPYERRVVKVPEDYEWLLSGEIQSYWEVIGNIHQNPELLEK